MRHAKLDPPPVVTKAPVAPRGFYCTSSPSNETVGTCTRLKPDCEAARATIVGAVEDLTACTLTERAFCFGEGKRCAASNNTCAAQWKAAGATAGECAGVE